MTAVETLESHACHGGTQSLHRVASAAIGLPMRFAVFAPPGPVRGALLYLAGLTSTEETFAIKAGAQRTAAAAGLVLVSCDTSPRDTGIAGAKDDWDFGEGAGFYLDATADPWSRRFRMESHVLELVEVAIASFGVDRARIGICGHSMGGHGALTLALRHPGLFRSVSAFAPIAAPTRCPWGTKAFSRYLGAGASTWPDHDASALMSRARCPYPEGILVDQGLADPYLHDQLHPEAFEDACRAAGQPLTLRRHAGYDHGYWFVQTFVADHVAFHAERLTS